MSLKTPLTPCGRGWEEDVVEPNMVARIKSCYGHFEVWSLWVIHQQMSPGGRERAAASPPTSGWTELTGSSSAMKLGWKLRPLQTAIWLCEDARQSSATERKAIELLITVRGECEGGNCANCYDTGCNIWEWQMGSELLEKGYLNVFFCPLLNISYTRLVWSASRIQEKWNVSACLQK